MCAVSIVAPALYCIPSLNTTASSVSAHFYSDACYRYRTCRERACKAYDTFSYFIAKFFVELPVNVIPSLIFSVIVYWIVGLNPHRYG
jgi:ABC-type multidrug transport system permease subunit